MHLSKEQIAAFERGKALLAFYRTISPEHDTCTASLAVKSIEGNPFKPGTDDHESWEKEHESGIKEGEGLCK